MRHKVIALTGGIGSGKSEVARILRSLGVKTLDCDAIAKDIADESETVEKVAKLLGAEYVFDGKLNRRAIRERVFADEALLEQYQALFFRGVKQRLTDTLQTIGDETVFVEIPILDAFDFDWDEVWRVESDEDIRVSRVTLRDDVSAENVKNILARQEHYANCTRVIVNNGSLDELSNAVRQALSDSGLLRGL